MWTKWNGFSLETRIKFSQNRKEDFRVTLVTNYLDHPDEPFTPTDSQIATLRHPYSIRQTIPKVLERQGSF
jgi:hypothetical protein